MTPQQYSAAIKQLGLSQRRAALLLGVNDRTSRRWALGEAQIREPVAILLRLMLVGKITMADIEAIPKTPPKTRTANR
jgi:DNA-binding transcriptional regulator YiaG